MTRTLSPRRCSVPGRPPLRVGGFSTVLRPRALVVSLLGLAALLGVLTINLGLGDYPLAPSRVLATLFGAGDYADRLVVLDLRLPRSLTGMLVGAALGLAGAVTQTIARNPLASPDFLGITWGAGMAATAVIVLGGSAGAVGGLLGTVGLPLVALGGGVVTGVVAYLLAYRRGVDSYRLVLVGVGINALTANATEWLLTWGDINEASRAMVWLTGSLNARSWDHVWPVTVALAVAVPLTLIGGHALSALQFGDDTVRGLGVRANVARGVLLLSAAGLAGVATAAAGPISFVALATPQIAVRLTGGSRPPLFPSLVLGALFVVVSDVVARTAFGGMELPVGIVTAVLGAPYLIYLLVRRYREVRT